MNEKEKWLKETGYELRPIDGAHIFKYRDGNYGAYNLFSLQEVIEMPLDFMKEVHKAFLDRAERKEEF